MKVIRESEKKNNGKKERGEDGQKGRVIGDRKTERVKGKWM
jgi:hypothetical protein